MHFNLYLPFFIFVAFFTGICRSLCVDARMDSPEPWQIGFQDPATPIAQGIQDLHHDIFFFHDLHFTLCSLDVSPNSLAFSRIENPTPAKIIHGTAIEVAWTVIPSLILIIIAIPSFALLYSMDEVVDPALTLKAIGHQWYWTYEYSDYTTADDTSIVYDSYMIPEEDLSQGQLRLLEVDHRVVLPINTHIRVIVTGADVLHSWAIPSLGVKCDAIPGRLNQTSFFLQREGVFYGQCSEICGANHGFMPIVVEGVKIDDYIAWVSNKMDEI